MALSQADREALKNAAERGDLRALRAMLDQLDANTVGNFSVTGTLAVTGEATHSAETQLAGVVHTAYAATATADGLTTAIIPDAASFVTVTSGNAAHIITLPAPVVGKEVMLSVGANGFELRTSDPATIGINGGTPGANTESAIPANTFVRMVCKSATEWVGWDLTGTTFAAVEASAA